MASGPPLRVIDNELSPLLFDVQGVVPVAAVHDVRIRWETFCCEGKFELPSVHALTMERATEKRASDRSSRSGFVPQPTAPTGSPQSVRSSWTTSASGKGSLNGRS